MKKLLTCFFAIAIIAPAALAVDGAVSRVIPTGGDEKASGATARTSVSRVATRAHATQNTVQKKTSRNVTSRAVSQRNNTEPAVTPIVQGKSNTISRAVSTEKSVRASIENATSTSGRSSRTSAFSINSNPAVRRAGLTLRPSTAEVGGRATIGNTGVQTGSNISESIRNVQSRAAKAVTAESIAEATNRLEQTATLNKSCQEQYNECMDQFCAVIDANQGRCSCSANLSKYTKVEEAVKDANTQLNEVAQRIRYVGLSADEIRAIMTETEAEEALNGTADTSETRNMLEEIEELIRDPNITTSTYSADTFGGLDMDLDFTSDTADIFSLDFLNTDSTGSFSNLRGTQLYNAAKKRCNSVLTQCKEAGATSEQITGNYDLAIDKDCIAYEKGLTKMNETLVSNVRSANRMLQKARLSVLQNKNQYDAKGCIAALDTCMRDEMVCGDNYFKCVDPTKRYIDENGNVVLGQDISQIIKFMTNYNNASIDATYLTNAYEYQSITEDSCNNAAGDGKTGGNDGSCVAKYLLTKIGTKQKVTDEGLCRAVLDKCQRYTYDSNENYKSFNDIVVNYVQRAMTNIRSAQSKIISEYASKCMVDVANCYNQQVSQVNSWDASASAGSIYGVMRGACRNVALTCAYAVFNDCDGGNSECPSTPDDYIEAVSDMFYQSLLCPANSTYVTAPGTAGTDSYVNSHCKCIDGYEIWGGACVAKCPTQAERNSAGTCVCPQPFQMINGRCAMNGGVILPNTNVVYSTNDIIGICATAMTRTACEAKYVYCQANGGSTKTGVCIWDKDNNKCTKDAEAACVDNSLLTACNSEAGKFDAKTNTCTVTQNDNGEQPITLIQFITNGNSLPVLKYQDQAVDNPIEGTE
ncbi:MAG: hypothetical protein R8M37_03695 [Alphaproteobacteria bacterium]|nr:hypothetical protein [Alphaproteobacteria bacterium]